jgi:SAM-dependent methyltransferase
VNPTEQVALLRTLLVEHGEGAWVVCGSSSMVPTFAPGARLRVVPAAAPRVGDVALFDAGDSVVTHRVLARVPLGSDTWILHAGDAGWGAGLVRQSSVLGRVLSPRRRPTLTRLVVGAAHAIRDVLRRAAARDVTPRMVPDPLATGRQYDAGADGLDAQFAGSRATVRRFDVIDEPQRRCARDAERVLEIGCGTGRLLATLGGRLRVGIDVSEGMLRIAAGKDLTVMRADAHRLPFAASSFEAITAGNGVFRYLDYGRAFAECARVLRRGGRLAVHQYSRWSLILRPRPQLAPDDPLHVGGLAEVRRPAGEAGFVEEKVYLWRNVSFWPYVVRLPELVAWRLWDHATFVFRKA